MTSINKANIPDNVNTVEKLLAWCANILADLNPTASIITSPGNGEKVADAFPLYFPANTPPTNRLVIVTYLPLPNDYRGAGRIDKAVTEIGTSTIPTTYFAA